MLLSITPFRPVNYCFICFVLLCPVQFSSVAQSCPTLCDSMYRSMPGLPVHHQLPEFTQTHIHWVGDAIQPSHLLLSPFPSASNPSQHQGLFQWINTLHEVAKVLEFQLQLQSFQWTLGDPKLNWTDPTLFTTAPEKVLDIFLLLSQFKLNKKLKKNNLMIFKIFKSPLLL